MTAPRLHDGPHLDAIAGLAFAIGGVIDVSAIDGRAGPMGLNVAAMLVLGTLVALRRRLPRAAAYGYALLLIVTAAVATPAPELVVLVIALLLFAYSAGSGLRGAWSVAYVPVLFAVIVAVNLEWHGDGHGVTVGDYVFPAALALAAYAAGRNVVHRSALAVELHEAAVRAGEEREAEARRAVAAERRRIAHEMHDVVAHSISVMVVQAGGARRILARDPERAREAAAQIERTGRETLLEMRRLLGVMRPPDASAELEPNPTLDGVADLVARARERGLTVEVAVDGERRPLRPGLEMTAYRVVEAALDDALRGRPGTVASLQVRWSPAALEITVADDRPSVPFAVNAGTGGAPPGVAERVALYGGHLRAGQCSDGGHEVHVRFPLDDAPPTTPPDSDPVAAQGAA